MILKCFIAEGATYNHHIFIKSGGTSLTSSAFSKQLPSLVPRSSDSSFQQSSSATREEVDNLKIAWRYKDSSPLPATLSTRGNALVKNKGHNQKLSATTKFEFTKKCSVEDLGGQRLTISHDDEEESFSPAEASANSNILLREIIRIAKEFEPVKKPNSFLRIALSHCENELTPDFMTSLRAIVRHTDSCVVLTISDLQDIELRLMIEHFADYVIEFQSILDEVKKKQLGGIDGLCEIKKMNSFNSIKPIEKPKDLGFSFHKKRFVFQVSVYLSCQVQHQLFCNTSYNLIFCTLQELHLQPEDETTAQREVTSKSKTISSQESSSSSSCGGSTIKGKSIDF